ncbi:MAG: signal peptide peptidase SppA [Planctomycetota bacterium]|nr:MAG: signal peptide peptidase SppA [Planctomycetota bacterium]
MDFEQDNNRTQPVCGSSESLSMAAKSRKGIGWKIFWGIVLALSVLANIVLFIMLIGVIAAFAAGQQETFSEEIIRDGPRTAKIAVINVQGIIDGEQAEDVYGQIKSAKEDKHVKGLILRVNSPGGMISGSDQICHEIIRYREKEEKPVVAFMQSVAASGGYYVSVPCDKIVAEPTAITGSVGVIAGHFVLQELLEEKLGVQPAIVKSGEKKDWPSPFKPFTDEQRQYIQDKLITPAYERFVQVVVDGREELAIADVKRLADGSIYGAQEALDEKLIDKIGYLDEAIEEVKSLAEIAKARVVEYRRPFSFVDVFGSYSRNLLKIDKTTLYEFTTPQVMYLWSLY